MSPRSSRAAGPLGGAALAAADLAGAGCGDPADGAVLQHLCVVHQPLSAQRAKPGEHAAAAEPGASVRHRQFRARRLQPRAACGQARHDDRRALRALPVDHRRLARLSRRLWGRLRDTVIMRTVDIFTAFPFLVLAIAIIAILGAGLTSMFIALTLVGWSAYTRIVRGEILVVKRVGVHPGGAGAGLQQHAHHAAPRPAQRHHPDGDLCHGRHHAGDPVDHGAQLPGAGRAAADRRMGHHDRRRAQLHHDGVVDGDVARAWPSCSSGLASASLATAWPTSCGRKTEPWNPSLEMRNLTTQIPTKRGVLTAVDDVSFSLQPGEIFGMVGESGSGKSMTCRSILQLVPSPGKVTSGEVIYRGRDLLRLSPKEFNQMRGQGDRDDLPGPHGRAQPGAAGRGSADRGDAGARRSPSRSARRSSAASNCCGWSASPPPSGGCATIRTSSAAACASAW